MQTRRLGKTGLSVSAIGLGTWQLSGDAQGAPAHGSQAAEELYAEADASIARARALGVTLFETADLYGAGDGSLASGVGATHGEPMERRLGRLLDGDADAIICTRGGNDLLASPPRRRFDREHLRTSAQRSAERLRRAPDLYLLHHPNVATVQRGEATGALIELAKEKVIGHWGVACGDGEVAQAALDAGAEVVELPYNVLHYRELHSISADVRAMDVGVLARSPLAYGLLCGTWSPEKAFPEGDHRRERWHRTELTERLRHVSALRPLVQGDVHTLRAVALRFVLANELVSSCVVGARTQAQVEQNVRAVGDEPPYLPASDLARITDLLEEAGAPR